MKGLRQHSKKHGATLKQRWLGKAKKLQLCPPDTQVQDLNAGAASMESTELPSIVVATPAIYYPPPFPQPNLEVAVKTSSYCGGAIMVGRALASLAPPPLKTRRNLYEAPPEPRTRIAGWNDGSLEWRNILYNMRPPSNGEASVFWNSNHVVLHSGTDQRSSKPLEEYSDIPNHVLIRDYLATFANREKRRVLAYRTKGGALNTARLMEGDGQSSNKPHDSSPRKAHEHGKKYAGSKLSTTSNSQIADAETTPQHQLKSTSSI